MFINITPFFSILIVINIAVTVSAESHINDFNKEFKDCNEEKECGRAFILCGVCKRCLSRSVSNFPCCVELKDADPRFIFKSSKEEYVWVCSDCGEEWTQSVVNRLRRRNGELKCTKCNRKCKIFERSLANFEVHKELKDKTLIPRDIYARCITLLDWICSVCKHEWPAQVCARTNGVGCPECAHEKKRTCTDPERSLFKFEVHKELVDKSLDPKKIYAGSHQLLLWKCSDCEYVWHTMVFNRTKGSKCPECSLVKKAEFQRMCSNHERSLFKYSCWEELVDKSLDPKKIYAGSGKILEWQCKKCDCKWKTRVNHRTSDGTGCPFCRYATAKIIYEFLKTIDPGVIEIEKKFDWSRGKSNIRYRFDFYLPKYNLIIECDGNQHFEDVKFWKSEVIERVAVDIRKTIDVFNNGISMIRICQMDVRSNTFNWKAELLQHIKEYDVPEIFYLSKDPKQYNYHKAVLADIMCL